MGFNATAYLAYGYPLDPDVKPPWHDLDGVAEWWRSVNGFKPKFEIYDEFGNYLNGEKPDKSIIDKYYDQIRQWDRSNPPLPVVLVPSGSYEHTSYFVAIPNEVIYADWGDFISLGALNEQDSPDPSDVEKIKKFVKRYKIKTSGKLGWYLFAYYG